MTKKVTRKNREISWLAFNERVLQEAADDTVPVLERLKFLAIFSSNLDEFFRVRVASLRRLITLKKKELTKARIIEPEKTLQEIQKTVIRQQEKFGEIYKTKVFKELEDRGIFIIDEKQLNEEQERLVKEYFTKEVFSHLFPVLLDKNRPFPHMRDKSIYLAVKMSKADYSVKTQFAIIEIPSDVLGRFYILPEKGRENRIIILDDVIRNNLKDVFTIFNYDEFEAYTIKLTRDAELDLDEDIAKPLLEKVRKSLKQRTTGTPVRFIYDETMPKEMLNFLIKRIGLTPESLIPGSRYHNFKDFMDFPTVGTGNLRYKTNPQIPIPELDKATSIIRAMKKRDFLLSHPYQSFDYVIRLLRESAIDPKVTTIKMTLYRVAKHSNIVNALINAIKNGKRVVVVMELQARFDEESNIYWSNQLIEAGAEVKFGLPNFKIHSKLCLITRKEDGETVRYAHLGTGNYNGKTARLYCDHGLLTKNKAITAEVERVFKMIDNFEPANFKYHTLLVAPVNMKHKFLSLLDHEIKNALKGKKAYAILKMNSLVDDDIIEKLYEASQSGVKIQMIVRGICCLLPGVKGLSENIEVVSIIDKYLEHARVYIFGNNGREKIYMASADWMTRNLEHRVEVAFPIYSPEVREELKDIINIQLADNTKARIINRKQNNLYKISNGTKVRSQEEIYNYLKNKYTPSV